MGDVYEHVVGTEHNFDLDLSSLTTPTDPLVCNNLAIAPVQLQTGDVVGACVFETMMPNRAQLDLVGQSAIGSTLYSASNSGCIRNNPPPNVSVQDLSSPLTSTILHLSAIISKSLQYVHYSSLCNVYRVAILIIIFHSTYHRSFTNYCRDYRK